MVNAVDKREEITQSYIQEEKDANLIEEEFQQGDLVMRQISPYQKEGNKKSQNA